MATKRNEFKSDSRIYRTKDRELTLDAPQGGSLAYGRRQTVLVADISAVQALGVKDAGAAPANKMAATPANKAAGASAPRTPAEQVMYSRSKDDLVQLAKEIKAEHAPKATKAEIAEAIVVKRAELAEAEVEYEDPPAPKSVGSANRPGAPGTTTGGGDSVTE